MHCLVQHPYPEVRSELLTSPVIIAMNSTLFLAGFLESVQSVSRSEIADPWASDGAGWGPCGRGPWCWSRAWSESEPPLLGLFKHLVVNVLFWYTMSPTRLSPPRLVLFKTEVVCMYICTFPEPKF